MESVDPALTNSNRKEKTLTGGDAFSVDDLLDFPNDDVLSADDGDSELKLLQRNEGDSFLLNDENTLPRSDEEDLGSLPTSGLAVPMDDLPELEWLSNFVEDSSFTTYSPPKEKPVWLTGDRKHPVPPVHDESCLRPPLPLKTRPKRARPGLNFFTDSSSSSATSSSSSSALPCLHEPMAPKQKKKKKKLQTRKCSHCGVQKTPQWREGPMGLKTLCNACGVRYKSGRLLPEYRPACSPTFSSELHSNHHRKVVEMRRQKEKPDDVDQTALNQSVQVVPTF